MDEIIGEEWIGGALDWKQRYLDGVPAGLSGVPSTIWVIWLVFSPNGLAAAAVCQSVLQPGKSEGSASQRKGGG